MRAEQEVKRAAGSLRPLRLRTFLRRSPQLASAETPATPAFQAHQCFAPRPFAVRRMDSASRLTGTSLQASANARSHCEAQRSFARSLPARTRHPKNSASGSLGRPFYLDLPMISPNRVRACQAKSPVAGGFRNSPFVLSGLFEKRVANWPLRQERSLTTRLSGAFGSFLLVSFGFISFGFIGHRSPPVVAASLQSAQHLRCPALDAIGTCETCLDPTRPVSQRSRFQAPCARLPLNYRPCPRPSEGPPSTPRARAPSTSPRGADAY